MEKAPRKNKEFDIERVKNQLSKIAKHNCKHCHGRGYIGNRIGEVGRLIVCRCALKEILPEMAKRKVEEAKKNANKSRNKKEVLKKS